MKRVFTTTEIDEALVYQAILREHGIDSIIENERSAFLVLDMPTCAVPFVIVVSDDQGGAALEIVEAALSHRLEEDAPAPEANASEPDKLEEHARQARHLRHRKWWVIVLFFYLLPLLSITLITLFQGVWELASGAAILMLAGPVSAWFLIRHRRRKLPA